MHPSLLWRFVLRAPGLRHGVPIYGVTACTTAVSVEVFGEESHVLVIHKKVGGPHCDGGVVILSCSQAGHSSNCRPLQPPLRDDKRSGSAQGCSTEPPLHHTVVQPWRQLSTALAEQLAVAALLALVVGRSSAFLRGSQSSDWRGMVEWGTMRAHSNHRAVWRAATTGPRVLGQDDSLDKVVILFPFRTIMMTLAHYAGDFAQPTTIRPSAIRMPKSNRMQRIIVASSTTMVPYKLSSSTR
jgi:hypothetical protein